MNILCITPIKHLKGIYEQLCKKGCVIYKPYIEKKQLRNYLIKNQKIDLLFCNPNKQN